MYRHIMTNDVTLNTCDIVHNIWKTHGQHLRFPCFSLKAKNVSFVIKMMLSWLRFFKNMTCPQLLDDCNSS